MRRLGPIVDGPTAGLFYGAPAVTLVLHLAPNGYQRALDRLDDVNEVLTRTRLNQAHERIDRGRLADFAEYDVLRGLSGLAMLWLQRGTRPELLRDVVNYLVRLTEPVLDVDGPRAGWRVWHRPDDIDAAGAHTNNGLAHGVCGPLAALALAQRRGIIVDGQEEAMRRVLRHLDTTRRHAIPHSGWARWDAQTATATSFSWCYGTPGLVRAQQLAALALGDRDRCVDLEQTLLAQLRAVLAAPPATDMTACHGTAGILRTCERIAADATDPRPFVEPVTALRERLGAPGGPLTPGLLDGQAGVLLTVAGSQVPWDACLALI